MGRSGASVHRSWAHRSHRPRASQTLLRLPCGTAKKGHWGRAACRPHHPPRTALSCPSPEQTPHVALVSVTVMPGTHAGQPSEELRAPCRACWQNSCPRAEPSGAAQPAWGLEETKRLCGVVLEGRALSEGAWLSLCTVGWQCTCPGATRWAGALSLGRGERAAHLGGTEEPGGGEELLYVAAPCGPLQPAAGHSLGS